MSKIEQQNGQPEAANTLGAEECELRLTLQSATERFCAEYTKNERLSVLVAHQDLLHLVRTGVLSHSELKDAVNDNSTFEAILFAAETSFQKRKDQTIVGWLAKLDKNTHWKAAAAVSLGTGMVTGLVFAVASPFITVPLQPYAEQLLKRQTPIVETQSAQSLQPVPSSSVVYNYTTTNAYNFYFPESKPEQLQPTQTPKAEASKPQDQLACKSSTINGYNRSLLELLQGGNTVTLEAYGRKVTLCYRPHTSSAAQSQALTK